LGELLMQNIELLLSKYWAKSDGTTIREHTDKLLENLKILKNLYGEKIEKKIPQKFKNKFWKLLELACEYHDYGKLHCKFQHKVGNKSIKCPEGVGEVRHNLLSPLFLYELQKDNYDEDDLLLVRLVILNHHRVNVFYVDQVMDEIAKVAEKEFEITDEETYEFIEQLLEDDEYTILEQNFKKDYESVRKTYILLKGFLLRLDHASSSKETNIPVEVEPVNTLKVLEEKFSEKGFKFNNLQNFVRENIDKNLLAVASTGYGKTEAGAIFLKEKGFFTLPVRTAINAIYSRFKGYFGKEKVGLLHSSAISYLLSAEDEFSTNKGEGILNTYFGAKQYSQPLIVSTPDQILPFVFHYEGFEKQLSLFAYSRIVLDEIQAYEPHTLAFIVNALREITEIGGKFLITTATLPAFLREKLKNLIDKEATFVTNTTRHHIRLIDEEIVQNVKQIAEYSKKGKVLVIANTVGRAIEIKQLLEERGVKANLLHSRFIRKDRQQREKEIEEFFQRGENGIWITTQLAEASLNIDADYLFTELSTADSLVQRMGRVNRFGKKDISEPNVFIFTEKPSGVRKGRNAVYSAELVELTLRVLKQFGNGPWDEEKKLELVEEVYSEENLKGTLYLNRYREADSFIKSLHKTGLREKKNQAIALFRNILNITVIPIGFKTEVENLLEEYEKNTTFLEKLKIREQVLDYTTSVPYYWKLKNKELFELPTNKKLHQWGIEFVKFPYTDNGLIGEEENPSIENIF
jgi:CRISPR-associated endonuclease/helicase Cas3